MSKKITKFGLIVFAMSLLTSCATMMGVKAPVEMRSMEKIVEIPDNSKDELYIKANSWFVETFNSAESVIEFQDKEAGKIMGKYIFSYAEGVYTYNVKQTVDIAIKDNKVKITISNPMFKATSGMGETYTNTSYRVLETQKGIDRARTEWNTLINSLVEYLKTDSDW